MRIIIQFIIPWQNYIIKIYFSFKTLSFFLFHILFLRFLALLLNLLFLSLLLLLLSLWLLQLIQFLPLLFHRIYFSFYFLHSYNRVFIILQLSLFSKLFLKSFLIILHSIFHLLQFFLRDSRFVLLYSIYLQLQSSEILFCLLEYLRSFLKLFLSIQSFLNNSMKLFILLIDKDMSNLICFIRI